MPQETRDRRIFDCTDFETDIDAPAQLVFDTMKDVGRLGPACGDVRATFPDPDHVRLMTSYGTFTLRIERSSGRPLETFGPSCSG